jgi:hypothetical protein
MAANQEARSNRLLVTPVVRGGGGGMSVSPVGLPCGSKGIETVTMEIVE